MVLKALTILASGFASCDDVDDRRRSLGETRAHGVGGVDEDRIAHVAERRDRGGDRAVGHGEDDDLGTLGCLIEADDIEAGGGPGRLDLVAVGVASREADGVADLGESGGEVGADDAGADDGDAGHGVVLSVQARVAMARRAASAPECCCWPVMRLPSWMA